MTDRRRQILKETKRNTNLRFNVGDFVLLPSHKNSSHPNCYSKVMTRFQDPYKIVSVINPVKFEVRLLDKQKTFPVH